LMLAKHQWQSAINGSEKRQAEFRRPQRMLRARP
jgi:hypothetical protein